MSSHAVDDETEAIDPDDRWAVREMRRQRAVEEAVMEADRIVMDGSDGSCEMTDYLTSLTAIKLAGSAYGITCDIAMTPEARVIVGKALAAVDEVVGKVTATSRTEADFIASSVALKFAEKAHHPYTMRLLRLDIAA